MMHKSVVGDAWVSGYELPIHSMYGIVYGIYAYSNHPGTTPGLFSAVRPMGRVWDVQVFMSTLVVDIAPSTELAAERPSASPANEPTLPCAPLCKQRCLCVGVQAQASNAEHEAIPKIKRAHYAGMQFLDGSRITRTSL